MPFALLTGLRSQGHLWRRKAWMCRGDNLYPYLREKLLKVAGEQRKLKLLMAFFMQRSDSKNYFLSVNRHLYLYQHHQNKSK